MKILLTAIVTILIVPVIGASTFISPVSACSCIQPGTPTEELERSDLVFRGVANLVQEPADQTNPENQLENTTVSFSVSKVWKGEPQSRIHIKTTASSAACGYNFETNEEYIVYANIVDGEPNVSLCSRTSLVSVAADDIVELGEGRSVDPSDEPLPGNPQIEEPPLPRDPNPVEKSEQEDNDLVSDEAIIGLAGLGLLNLVLSLMSIVIALRSKPQNTSV